MSRETVQKRTYIHTHTTLFIHFYYCSQSLLVQMCLHYHRMTVSYCNTQNGKNTKGEQKKERKIDREGEEEVVVVLTFLWSVLPLEGTAILEVIITTSGDLYYSCLAISK